MSIRANSFRLRLLRGAAAMAVLMVVLTACGTSGSPAPAGSSHPTASAATGSAAQGSGQAGGTRSQAPVPAESNPPGDIPDSTVYVTYQSVAGHLLLKVPEGWSRKTAASSTTFTSNLNSVGVAWGPVAAAPTVTGARTAAVRALQAHSLAFRLQDVRAVTLAGGPAVEIIYQVNSPPNPVTGRQYRLVVERFELYHSGHGAVVELSSAVGSDNVDPWRTVSASFRWM